MINKFFLFIITILLITACSQTVNLQTIPAQTSFETSAEKAVIYLYRDEDFGGSLPLLISINNIEVGKTTGKTFFRIAVRPGEYRITTELSNRPPVILYVEARKNYFLRQEVKIGMTRPNVLLEVVDSSRGEEGVRLSNRLEPNPKLNF
jgi:hypothetical protein